MATVVSVKPAKIALMHRKSGQPILFNSKHLENASAIVNKFLS